MPRVRAARGSYASLRVRVAPATPLAGWLSGFEPSHTHGRLGLRAEPGCAARGGAGWAVSRHCPALLAALLVVVAALPKSGALRNRFLLSRSPLPPPPQRGARHTRATTHAHERRRLPAPPLSPQLVSPTAFSPAAALAPSCHDSLCRPSASCGSGVEARSEDSCTQSSVAARTSPSACVAGEVMDPLPRRRAVFAGASVEQ